MTSLVILIITNEADEHNNTLEALWRQRLEHYSKLYPRMNYYFLKAREDLPEDYLIDQHDFFVKTKESIIPGILIKTLKAFEAISPDYDFTLRANISSIVLLDRFMTWLHNQPRQLLYAGVPHPFGATPKNCKWAFGAGYTISRDVAKLITDPDMLKLVCDNGVCPVGPWDQQHDDVFVGYICLIHHKITITPYPTIEFYKPEHMNQVVRVARQYPELFHLRIKLLDGSSRIEHEPVAHQLINAEILSSNSF